MQGLFFLSAYVPTLMFSTRRATRISLFYRTRIQGHSCVSALRCVDGTPQPFRQNPHRVFKCHNTDSLNRLRAEKTSQQIHRNSKWSCNSTCFDSSPPPPSPSVPLPIHKILFTRLTWISLENTDWRFVLSFYYYYYYCLIPSRSKDAVILTAAPV